MFMLRQPNEHLTKIIMKKMYKHKWVNDLNDLGHVKIQNSKQRMSKAPMQMFPFLLKM